MKKRAEGALFRVGCITMASAVLSAFAHNWLACAMTAFFGVLCMRLSMEAASESHPPKQEDKP